MEKKNRDIQFLVVNVSSMEVTTPPQQQGKSWTEKLTTLLGSIRECRHRANHFLQDGRNRGIEGVMASQSGDL